MSLSLCVLSLDFLRALDPLSFMRTRVLYICVYRRGSSGFARKGIITWDSPGRERERERRNFNFESEGRDFLS